MPEPVDPVDYGAMARTMMGTANPVAAQYPALAPYTANTVVSRGNPSGPQDDRQLEFYQPWESDNPTPGQLHVQLFNKNLQGGDLNEAIAGDLLHHLGSVDPRTGQPVDRTFYALKQQLGAARTPEHLRADQEAYKMEAANPSYTTSPYPQWDRDSRLDAYVRGGVFPKQNPGWDKYLTPEMQPIFREMRSYLTGTSAR
jgi:hypothetical protein